MTAIRFRSLYARHATVLATGLALAAGAFAAEPVKTDGKWRSTLGAGLSMSSGNTSTSSLTVDGQARRVTLADRWTLTGKGLYSRDNSQTTGERLRLQARHDWNLGAASFAFAGGEFEHDRIAELQARVGANGGAGYKLSNTQDLRFDVFAGLGLTHDRFTTARLSRGAMRETDNYVNGLLGEESEHRIRQGVSARQRFVLRPSFQSGGSHRAEFDAGLSLALSGTTALNVGFSVRHESRPLPGQQKTDTLLTTGVSVKFE